jgi:predicted MFS family arabinose efflux permease
MTTPTRRWVPHHSVLLAGLAAAMSIMGDQAMYVLLGLDRCYKAILHPLTLVGGVTLEPEVQVGILLSANRWIRLLTNHVAEWLVHHFHPSVLFVAMLALGAFTTGMYGTWPVFWVLLLARCGWGLCWSIIRQVGVMTAVDASSQNQAATVIGFYNGLTRAGSIVGMVLAGFLFDSYGFRMCFWILAGITLIGTLPAGLARRGLSHHQSLFRQNREIRPGTSVWSLLVIGFIVGCVGPGVIMSTMSKVLNTGLGDEVSIGLLVVPVATFSGIILATRHLINTLGGPTLGRLADVMGHNRSIITFFAVGLGVLVMAIFAASAWMMALVVVLSLLFFVCSTLLTVVLNAEASRAGSKAYAWFVSAEDCGSAAGPLLGWTVFAWYEHPTVPYSLGAGLLAVGLLMALVRSGQFQSKSPANKEALKPD